MIALVIIACEVKHAVQCEDLDFLGCRMPELLSIFRSDLSGNCHVTGKTVRQSRWKRKHIRRLVLASEATVQFSQLLAAGHEHVDLTF